MTKKFGSRFTPTGEAPPPSPSPPMDRSPKPAEPTARAIKGEGTFGAKRRASQLAWWVGALLFASVAGGCAPAPPSDQVTISFRLSRFEPSTVTIPVGVPVAVTLVNDDPIGHEWIVGPPELHAVHRVGTEPEHEGRPNEVSVPPYATRTTVITFDQPGTYAFICHLPGHEAYGMTGTLTVARGPSPLALR